MANNSSNLTAMMNVTSSDIESGLPVEIKSLLLSLLIPAVLYGVIWNILLLLQLVLHPDVRKHAGMLLMVLLGVNIFHSAVPSLAFLVCIIDNDHSNKVKQAVLCHVTSVGMVFTNNMNLMLMSSMAIQRYQLVMSRPVGRRFVFVSIAVITCLAALLSVYQAVRPGISYYICESLATSTYHHVAGTSGIMWVMMSPFLICCGLTLSMYCKIYIQVSRKLHLQNINKVLVRPLMWLFGMFLLSYLPVLAVILIRRVTSLTQDVLHAQLVVNAINFLGHAVSPSVYCVRSGLIMRKVLQKLCWQCKHRCHRGSSYPAPAPQPAQLIIVVQENTEQRKQRRARRREKKRQRKRKQQEENQGDVVVMKEINKHTNHLHPISAEVGHSQENRQDAERPKNGQNTVTQFPLLNVPIADDGLKVAPCDGIKLESVSA